MDYVNSAKESIQNAVPSGSDVTSSISDSISSVKNNISNTMNSFSSSSVGNAGSEFLNSNSIIAKFVFLIFVVAIFMILLNLGISFISYLTDSSRSPYVVKGMVSGNVDATISQDPANANSAVIYRSNNQASGIEFTWSMWLNVLSIPNDNKFHNIFNKGTGEYGQRNNRDGVDKVSDGPGVYLKRAVDGSSNSAEVVFIMNVITPDGGVQKGDISLTIPNFPLQKWCHVAFRLQNKILDSYVNGTIQNRVSFDNYIPKQNYESIRVGAGGGFSGYISNLRYYNYALSVFEINSIVYYGPNLTQTGVSMKPGGDAGYLSKSWYSNVFTNT